MPENAAQTRSIDEVVNSYLKPKGGVEPSTFRTIVSSTYDFFLEHRNFPTPKQLVERTPHSMATVLKVLDSSEYRTALSERGLPVSNSIGLSAEQSYFISILTNPTDRRTLTSKLKHAGVSYHIYRAWLRNPLFQSTLTRLTEGALTDHQGDVLIQLTNKAVGGDLSAIKYFLEVTGRHDPTKREQVDIQSFMQRVIEILMRHVTDADVLTAIAADLSMVGALSGSRNSSVPVQGEVVTYPVLGGTTGSPETDYLEQIRVEPEPVRVKVPVETLKVKKPLPVFDFDSLED